MARPKQEDQELEFEPQDEPQEVEGPRLRSMLIRSDFVGGIPRVGPDKVERRYHTIEVNGKKLEVLCDEIVEVPEEFYEACAGVLQQQNRR